MRKKRQNEGGYNQFERELLIDPCVMGVELMRMRDEADWIKLS